MVEIHVKCRQGGYGGDDKVDIWWRCKVHVW